MTIFLGCGFAAKYREGGGNFSVPLQWMLGLRRLKLDAIWLEVLPSTATIRLIGKTFSLSSDIFASMDSRAATACFCKSRKATSTVWRDGVFRDYPSANSSTASRARMSMLNLSYSVHPPLLLQFERRIFCDLDPSEIFYWMTKMEMGQSSHHEFWTIGLNVHGRRLPACRNRR